METEGARMMNQPSIHSEVGDDASKWQAATPRGSKVVRERVALLVLGALLVAAAIVIYRLAFANMKANEKLQTLRDECEPKKGSAFYPSCEKHWNAYGDKCYLFSFLFANWNKSRQSCQSQGGDLVKIESRDKQKFLENMLREEMRNGQDKFWIGLTDSDKEGEFFWVDGSPLNESLSFWSNDEPDDWKTENPNGEDCVRMGNHAEYTLDCWFDRSCDVPHRSICEKPMGN
ncbi:CD209 antigen-like protein C [Aulostomus maculatus]